MTLETFRSPSSFNTPRSSSFSILTHQPTSHIFQSSRPSPFSANAITFFKPLFLRLRIHIYLIREVKSQAQVLQPRSGKARLWSHDLWSLVLHCPTPLGSLPCLYLVINFKKQKSISGQSNEAPMKLHFSEPPPSSKNFVWGLSSLWRRLNAAKDRTWTEFEF